MSKHLIALAEAAPDLEQQVAAIARHVQQTLTYKPIEFGVRGQIPNKPAEVLADRFGDCKDHSVLLWSLLQSAGIPAHLALVNLSEPVDPDFPSLDQFDHMIVYVPNLNGGTFIDATDKNLSLGRFSPASLGGSRALVLNEEPRLMTMPDYHTTRMESERRITLEERGDLLVDETLRMNAYLAANLRAYFKSIDADGRMQWAQRFLTGKDDSLEVESIKVEQLDQPDEQIVLRLRYRKPSVFPDPRRATMQDFSFWESSYILATPVQNRRTDFHIRHFLTVDSRVSFRAPHLKDRDWSGGENTGAKSKFGEFSTQWQPTADGLDVIFSYKEHAGRHDAAAFEDYRAFGRQALDALRTPVRIQGD